jgi:glycosyltransferase involved in cell wall biosynthesis
LEAFAAGLPVVANDAGGVGAVAAGAAGAARLVDPGDAASAARQLDFLGPNPVLRDDLAECGLERVRGMTRTHEVARVAAFIAAA